MSYKQMIKRFFVELFDKKHQNYVAQQQQQALRSLQQISFWMQESLFISLQYSNYPFLQSFRAVQNIRPAGYSFKNNWYIFYYRLSATQIPARCLLKKMCNNMNTDIYTFQQQTVSQYGFDTALALYPFIIKGMYVLDAVPDGTDIVITVFSYYLPL